MLLGCQLRALKTNHGLASIQCALPALARRLQSSTPSDEFNREMAEFFSAAPPEQQQQQGGAFTSIAEAASGAAAAAQQAQQMPDVASVNYELFSFFGAPQQGAEGGSSASLALQLAALTGQANHHVPAAAPAQPRACNSISSSSVRSSSSISSNNCGEIATASSLPCTGGGSGPGSGASQCLTHVDAGGKAAMVDVSNKAATVRTATAGARVLVGREVFELVARNQLKKGDVLTVAQLAGVMGAKHTSTLIPLCHNILLSRVHVTLVLEPSTAAVDIEASATTVGPTGVEMEALTAAAVAALCVYDMCKAASKAIVVTDLRLLAKSGGRSGDWRRGAMTEEAGS